MEDGSDWWAPPVCDSGARDPLDSERREGERSWRGGKRSWAAVHCAGWAEEVK